MERLVEEIKRVVPLWTQLQTQHPKFFRVLVGCGACATILALRVVWIKVNSIIHKSPPQLYGLPFIGSLVTMIIWKNDFSRKLLPRYGDIVSFNVGSLKMYEINDLELMQAMFATANDRSRLFRFPFESNGSTPGVGVANNDEDWSLRRKAIMTNIVRLLNKSKLEENITKILQAITYKELDSNLGNYNSKYLWYPRNCVRNAAFNVIYSAMFGRSLMIDDRNYIEYSQGEKECVDNMLAPIMAKNLPKLIADVTGFTENTQVFNSAYKHFEKMVEKEFEQTEIIVKSSSNLNDNPTTLAECLTDEYKTHVQGNINTTELNSLAHNRLLSDSIALLFAGLDTTSHATEVGIILLAKHPDIQQAIQQELSDVYGKNGEFLFSKVNKCAQFRAFTNESLRISCGVPDGLCRTSSQDYRCIKWNCKQNNSSKPISNIAYECVDSQFDFDAILNDKDNTIVYDYIIKSNSWLQPNIAFLCIGNEKVWNLEKDPRDLNLNYWLKKDENNNGKLIFRNNRNSVPFSVGGRDCLGQSLARKELQAFLGNLILKYKIEAQNDDPSSIDIKFGFGDLTRTVKPQIPVLISKRI